LKDGSLRGTREEARGALEPAGREEDGADNDLSQLRSLPRPGPEFLRRVWGLRARRRRSERPLRRAADRRQVPGRAARRHRGDGRRLPGQAGLPQQAGRPEDPPTFPAGRRDGRPALQAGSARRQPAQPSQHHPDPRFRRAPRRRPVHDHGVRRGAGPREDHPAGAPAPSPAAGAHHQAGAQRARRGPRRGDHPPGHQAGQHPGLQPPLAARSRQGARLRHRQDPRPRSGRVRAHDPGWFRLRHARLHVAGAGPGAAPRPTHRSVLPRDRPVPVPHRPPPLRGRLRGGDGHQDRPRADSAAEQAAPGLGDPARARGGGHAGAAEAARPPLPQRRRDARPPRGGRAHAPG